MQDASEERLAAVAHLIELGYECPFAAAAARAAEARARDALLAGVPSRLREGDVAGALTELNTLSAAHPDWPEPRRQLARIHLQRGDAAAAERALDWLELHGVEHAEFSLMRATIALRRRELDAALDHAEYAKFLHQPSPLADVLIGDVQFRRGNLDDALAAYQRALDADGKQPAALSGLAAISLRRGDHAASIDYALRALALDMSQANTHYRLGIALMELRRPSEAIAALTMAARLNPRLAGPHRFLSRAYAELKDL